MVPARELVEERWWHGSIDSNGEPTAMRMVGNVVSRSAVG